MGQRTESERPARTGAGRINLTPFVFRLPRSLGVMPFVVKNMPDTSEKNFEVTIEALLLAGG